MNKDIHSIVKKVFIDVLENDNFELLDTSKIGDIDGWESSTHMMIISEIEDEFNIEFELDELLAMKNVGDLVSCIKNKI